MVPIYAVRFYASRSKGKTSEFRCMSLPLARVLISEKVALLPSQNMLSHSSFFDVIINAFYCLGKQASIICVLCDKLVFDSAREMVL